MFIHSLRPRLTMFTWSLLEGVVPVRLTPWVSGQCLGPGEGVVSLRFSALAHVGFRPRLVRQVRIWVVAQTALAQVRFPTHSAVGTARRAALGITACSVPRFVPLLFLLLAEFAVAGRLFLTLWVHERILVVRPRCVI